MGTLFIIHAFIDSILKIDYVLKFYFITQLSCPLFFNLAPLTQKPVFSQ